MISNSSSVTRSRCILACTCDFFISDSVSDTRPRDAASAAVGRGRRRSSEAAQEAASISAPASARGLWRRHEQYALWSRARRQAGLGISDARRTSARGSALFRKIEEGGCLLIAQLADRLRRSQGELLKRGEGEALERFCPELRQSARLQVFSTPPCRLPRHLPPERWTCRLIRPLHSCSPPPSPAICRSDSRSTGPFSHTATVLLECLASAAPCSKHRQILKRRICSCRRAIASYFFAHGAPSNSLSRRHVRCARAAPAPPQRAAAG